MKKLLITGCTGSLGQSVIEKLKHKYKIIGYSRDEQKQRLLPTHKNVIYYLGDVRDRDRLLEASRDVDMIMHFAALKCVDTLESNPEESIKTNIEGTLNVLHAQRLHKIPRVVFASTDKACHPANVYGACKFISERLVLRNNRNIVVRYGNVMASRGSVIPFFIKSLQNKEPVQLTHIKMNRFFLTLDDATRFVIKSSFSRIGGRKIPELKAVYIHDLIRALIVIMNIRHTVMIKIVGFRPGEKLSECLRTQEEGTPLLSHEVRQFSQRELIKKLKPIVKEFM